MLTGVGAAEDLATKAKSKVCKTTRRVCILEKRPRDCDLSHGAQDLDDSWFLAHDEPRLGFGEGKPALKGPTWAI